MNALTKASLLLKLKSSAPDDLQGLEFRIDKDEAEALRLLQAYGYYDGTVQRTLTPTAAADPAATAPADPDPTAAAAPTTTAAPRGPNTADTAHAAQGSAATSPSSGASSGASSGPSSGASPGTATTDSMTAKQDWRVLLTLTPGPRYTLGETLVRYTSPLPQSAPSASSSAASAAASSASKSASPTPPKTLPQSLADAGLASGAPVEAARILSAVERLPEILSQRGYPLAEVKDTRYAVDKATKQLFATVLVQPGPHARMGRLVVQGNSAVKPAYLEKLRTWESGTEWDQRQVDDFRDLLVRQGLFRSIDLKPVPALAAEPNSRPVSDKPTGSGTGSGSASAGHPEPLDPSLAATLVPSVTNMTAAPMTGGLASKSVSPTPIYDLVVTVADAPQRTVGGGVNYESNRGPGVQAYWEHRNLLGQGERFRAETSIWQDSQFAKATFRKPSFFDNAQEFVAEGWLRNEESIAYTQRAAWLSAGVERRLWKSVFASAGVSVEGGDLEDPTHPRLGYTMASIPLQVRYEGASGPAGGSSMAQLDPESGWRASLGIRPTWGTYGSSFTVTPTRLSLSGYWPLGSVTRSDNSVERIPRVVLAVRGAAGTLWRGDSQSIPAAARYYGGGGGSVRGYAYQSLGPRDGNGDPLGGASFAELSLEARIRVTQDIAIVPFLDGGNIYSGTTPGMEKDGRTTGLQWGAGLGLRYHTAVGPLRLDVATPLNPRKDDGPIFLYISIGQSF